jgi:DNA-binding CsgD family transcriptional regulator
MNDDNQLDDLIGLLYEAVIDSNRWKEAIGLCGKYIGGVDTQLLTIDKKTNIPISAVIAETTFPISESESYVNYYGSRDPRLHYFLSGSLGEWRSCHTIINSQSFIDKSEFYQDFLLPLGARYAIAGRIDENETTCTILGVIGAVNQRPFDEPAQLAAKRFTPNLQRAIRLHKHTQALQIKAELGAMAIDAFALSMIIVDSKATILHLNAKAEQFLNVKSSGLNSHLGYLTSPNSESRRQLARMINLATTHPAMGGAMVLQNNKSLQVFVTPLPAASQFARDWQIPLALVLIVEVGKAISNLHLLAEIYDFSPAELRVAAALLNGKTPEIHAHEMGVSINTVRTQLRSLFGKTETRGQTELIALLSNVPPLLT